VRLLGTRLAGASRWPTSNRRERERERERELNAPRRTLELKLAEVVVALREHCPDGNITLRVLETGDIVAILKVDDDEAADLAKLLGQH